MSDVHADEATEMKQREKVIRLGLLAMMGVTYACASQEYASVLWEMVTDEPPDPQMHIHVQVDTPFPDSNGNVMVPVTLFMLNEEERQKNFTIEDFAYWTAPYATRENFDNEWGI